MIEQSAERTTTQRNHAADWTRQPIGVLIGWVLPIALGLSSNVLSASFEAQGVPAFIWAAAFVWMGLACLLNARRCHRLHCYFSGPILLGGALLTILLGLRVISFGPHGLNNLVSGTFVLALLTYLPELIRGRYARH